MIPTPGSASGLSRLQKAAIIFRMLGSLGMPLPPGALTPEEEARITSAIEGLGGIDPPVLAAVIDEFLTTLSPGSGPAPAGGANDLGLPDLPVFGDLPIIDSYGGGSSSNGAPVDVDPWDVLIALDDAVLVTVLESEAPEVGAVLMSKLKVSRAAEMLGMLPGALARRITYAVSQISEIAPETVDRIGRAMTAELTKEVPRAFTGGPVERVGALLNFSRAATRDDVMEGLVEEDPVFAEAVRKSIFTFVNIPARVGPRDVPKIIRGVEQAVLVKAFAAAAKSEEMNKAAEFILSNISQRMAEAIRTEIADGEAPSAADGEAAMTAVVAAIRELEEAGEIYLVAEEVEEENA